MFMKSGNGFGKAVSIFGASCSYWAFWFQYALPLAACVLLGYGGYRLYKRWRYPLLQDHSLDDSDWAFKARIRQADKDIQQLGGSLGRERLRFL